MKSSYNIQRFVILISCAIISFNLYSCNSKNPKSEINATNKKEEKQKAQTSNLDLGANNSQELEHDTIYESFNVDSQPYFNGGDEAFTDYIQKRIQYPLEAKKNGIEGTVYVRFVVTKVGTIGETQIMRTVDPYLELEAIRLVKNSPKWNPGKKDGKPVNVWFIIPVKFTL